MRNFQLFGPSFFKRFLVSFLDPNQTTTTVQQEDSATTRVLLCLGSFLNIMAFPIGLGIFVLVAMGAGTKKNIYCSSSSSSEIRTIKHSITHTGESTPWCTTEPNNCLCASAVQAKLEDLGLEFCKNYVTWPVKSSAFTIDSDYLNATEAAQAYYLNNTNLTLSDSHDDLYPDPGVYTYNLLSYQPYWGCVLNFPHCKQEDSNRAHCKLTCKEFNRRARGGNEIPKESCAGLPGSNCSSGVRNGVSVASIIFMGIVLFINLSSAAV